MKRTAFISFIIFSTLLATSLNASWPTFRHDNSRSNSTKENLPEKLSIAWTLDLGPIVSSWPYEDRTNTDASYEPIVADGRLFLANPNNDSITARNVETGELLWTFFTNAPVRCAPTFDNKRLYFVCDDSFLYCLNAETGEQLWKFRGAPKGRPIRRHLGNGRLISYWPARGGALVANNRVYFGAGLWPGLGTTLHCLDASMGTPIWSNENISMVEGVRLDHNNMRDTGIVPQGFMALTKDDKLIVPTGRSLPAGFNAKTGDLLWYIQGYRNGYWRVATTDKYVFVGPNGVIDLRTGREVGSRWLEGDKIPDRFAYGHFDLFEGPLPQYKYVPGCSASSAFSGNKVYGVSGSTFYCHDLSNPTLELVPKNLFGFKQEIYKWTPQELWKFETDLRYNKWVKNRLVVNTPKLIFAAINKHVLAFRPPTGAVDGAVVWKYDLKEKATSLVVSEKTLFVTTKSGKIHAFRGNVTESKIIAIEEKAIDPIDAKIEKLAASINDNSSMPDGYAVVLGISNGQMIDALLVKSSMSVIALDNDEKKIRELRAKYNSTGLYGSRIHLIVSDPNPNELPAYLASVVLSEKYSLSDFMTKMESPNIYRLLRPYGGVLCLNSNEKTDKLAFENWAKPCWNDGAELLAGDSLLTLRRPGTLKGSSYWSYQGSNPQRTYCSQDEVRPPFAPLWYGDGKIYGSMRNPNGYDYNTKPQAVGGFCVSYSRMGHAIECIDSYTGRKIWSQKVTDSRFSSYLDGIYLINGNKLEIFDLKTGEKTFSTPIVPETKPKTRYRCSLVIVDGDVILTGLGPENRERANKGRFEVLQLIAFDRETREKLWERKAKDCYCLYSVCMGDGKVFVTDSPAPSIVVKKKKDGEEPKPSKGQVEALDARTGKTLWTSDFDSPPKTINSAIAMRSRGNSNSYSSKSKILLSYLGVDLNSRKRRGALVRGTNADTGEVLWNVSIYSGFPPYVISDDVFMIQGGGNYNLKTGKQNGRIPYKKLGCNNATGSVNMVMVRHHFASVLDKKTKKQHYVYSLRSGCSNNYVPADGVLGILNYSAKCVCNYPVQTSIVLTHSPEVEAWHPKSTIKAAIPSGPEGRKIGMEIMKAVK